MHLDVLIKDIIVGGDRLRRVDREKVEEIADSISSLGRLMHPIILREDVKGKYRLIAGEHRLEAFKLLKHDVIPSSIKVADDTREGQLEDEIEEIDENIARAEMTDGEIRLATKRRKKAYVELSAIRREKEAQAAHDKALVEGKASDKTRNAVRDAKRALGAKGTRGGLNLPANRKASAEFTKDTADRHGISTKAVERRVREADEIEEVAAWAKVDPRDLAVSSVQTRSQLAAALEIINKYGSGMAVEEGNVHHVLKTKIRKAATKGENHNIVEFKARVDKELRKDELSEKRSNVEGEKSRHLISLISKAAKAVLDAQDAATSYQCRKIAEKLSRIKLELRSLTDGQAVEKDLSK